MNAPGLDPGGRLFPSCKRGGSRIRRFVENAVHSSPMGWNGRIRRVTHAPLQPERKSVQRVLQR